MRHRWDTLGRSEKSLRQEIWQDTGSRDKTNITKIKQARKSHKIINTGIKNCCCKNNTPKPKTTTPQQSKKAHGEKGAFLKNHCADKSWEHSGGEEWGLVPWQHTEVTLWLLSRFFLPIMKEHSRCNTVPNWPAHSEQVGEFLLLLK